MHAMVRFASKLVLPSAFWLGACSGSLDEGKTAFQEARYADAAAAFRVVETEPRDGCTQAQYELYAGLNHLALGNRSLAARHLQRARDALETHPQVFTAEEQGRLFRAWRSLGRLPGQPLSSR